jgi:hypothetical protein
MANDEIQIIVRGGTDYRPTHHIDNGGGMDISAPKADDCGVSFTLVVTVKSTGSNLPAGTICKIAKNTTETFTPVNADTEIDYTVGPYPPTSVAHAGAAAQAHTVIVGSSGHTHKH